MKKAPLEKTNLVQETQKKDEGLKYNHASNFSKEKENKAIEVDLLDLAIEKNILIKNIKQAPKYLDFRQIREIAKSVVDKKEDEIINYLSSIALRSNPLTPFVGVVYLTTKDFEVLKECIATLDKGVNEHTSRIELLDVKTKLEGLLPASATKEEGE